MCSQREYFTLGANTSHLFQHVYEILDHEMIFFYEQHRAWEKLKKKKKNDRNTVGGSPASAKALDAIVARND